MLRPVPRARIEGLANDAGGLTADQVNERRVLYGSNEIVAGQQTGWARLIGDTLRDPMIWFLLATSLLFVWLGNYTEALVLALALLPIAGMDAYLHRRTQASIEGLTGQLASSASAVRDGSRHTVPAIGLVPGDLIVTGEGETIPADGLVVEGSGLLVDEFDPHGRGHAGAESTVPCPGVRGGRAPGRWPALGIRGHPLADRQSDVARHLHRRRNALRRDRPFCPHRPAAAHAAAAGDRVAGHGSRHRRCNLLHWPCHYALAIKAMA